MDNIQKRKPEWLKVKSGNGSYFAEVTNMLSALNLHTVCQEALCPNRGECFGNRTATFMILGKNCTRNCRFCNVTKAPPSSVDPSEPANVAAAVKKLNLRHVVITSVTRDDLADGGSAHFANVITAIKEELSGNPPIIEVLIPDFQGDYDSLMTVINAKPDIINHNIETVPRLYPDIRPLAIYERSLKLLKRVKKVAPDIATKSGIMVGLGETFNEVLDVLKDLIANDCEILTVGQYLAPSKFHHPVIEYIHPQVFDEYKKQGESMGLKYVASGPLVRSSYMAEKAFEEAKKTK